MSVYHGVHKCTLGTNGSEEARMHAPAGDREGLHVGWWDFISSGLLFSYFSQAELGLGLVVLSHRVKINK